MALDEDDPSGVQILSASVTEIQELADKILERLGVRLTRAGQMVIHFDEGRVQRVETRTYHRVRRPNDQPHGGAARIA